MASERIREAQEAFAAQLAIDIGEFARDPDHNHRFAEDITQLTLAKLYGCEPKDVDMSRESDLLHELQLWAEAQIARLVRQYKDLTEQRLDTELAEAHIMSEINEKTLKKAQKTDRHLKEEADKQGNHMDLLILTFIGVSAVALSALFFLSNPSLAPEKKPRSPLGAIHQQNMENRKESPNSPD